MGTTTDVVDWIAARRPGRAATEVVPLPRRRWDPGALAAQKGLDVLVDTLPSVPGAFALLVGDGPEKSALLERAAAAGVADRLTVTSWRDDARDYLGALDVFVLPSRFEGFPQAVVEAMLAERAVVASDVGSVSDAVVHGETGLLVPPDDPAARADALRILR